MINASKKQHNKKKNQQGNDKDKNKSKPSHKKPDWMFREPEQKELMKPKTWNNREWWFCGKKTGGQCEQYRQHKGKDCQGKSYFASQKYKQPNDDDNQEPNDPHPKQKSKRRKSSKSHPKLSNLPVHYPTLSMKTIVALVPIDSLRG